ncbi:DHA2 family efflux MFS transporter permease subunit [Actinosynnema sp. NPDC059797]
MSTPAAPVVGTRRRIALFTVFATSLIAMLDLTISAVALPVIRTDLSASLTSLQWMFDAYTLAFAGLVLTGGAVSDRLGHRTGLLASTTLFIVGSAVCGLADNAGVLIAGRALQGVGAAMLVPAAMALISLLAGGDAARAKLLGIWSALSGAAIAFGPVAGGWLVATFDWRILFQINVPLGIAAIVLVVFTVDSIAPGEGRKLDFPGLLLGSLTALALAYGIIEGVVIGFTSPVILASFAVAALALVAFIVVERRSENAMMPLSLFSIKPFTASTIVAFVLGFGLSSSFFFLSQLLQQAFGYSPFEAGLGFLPAALMLVLAAPIAGKLMAKFGAAQIVAAGLAIGGVGLAALWFTDADTGYGGIWWAVALIGIGWGMTLPPVNTVALGAVPPERAGTASGTVETGLQFGTVVGIAAIGAAQVSTFLDELRERLAAQPLGDQLGRVTEQLSEGRVPGDAPVAADVLTGIAQAASASGLNVAFLVAGVVTIAAIAPTLWGMPRKAFGDPAAAPAADGPTAGAAAETDASAPRQT